MFWGGGAGGITCPCSKEIQCCVQLRKYVLLYIRYLQRNAKKGDKKYFTLAAHGLEEVRVDLLLKKNSYVSDIILH